jgi:hypothetical protein
MNKKLKIVLIVLGILLIGFGLYKLITYKPTEKYFKPVVFNKVNWINNKTSMKYVDTILRVGLDELGIENISIMVKPFTKKDRELLGPDIVLKAQVKSYPNGFIIWMDDLGRSESLTVLSHELIHIQQYSTKELVVSGTNVTYKGIITDVIVIPYSEREWEIDAFAKEGSIKNTINRILY